MLLLASDLHARDLRDGLGSFEDAQLSEHFALKWGDVQPDPAIAQATLDALEDAWTVLVDDAGYPPPRDADIWYVNVYVGNSGGDAPTIDWIGGFVTEDDEGYAYMVLAGDAIELFSGDDPDGVSMDDPVTWASELCAHEFFHTIEFGTDAFNTLARTDKWVWESGANHAAHLVVPDGPIAPYQTMLYWTTPYHPMTSLGEDTPDAKYGSSRSYGVWSWWAYLDEVIGAPELMRDMWTTPTPDEKPLDVLVAVMESEGLDFPTLFLDFAVHNATFDYSFGDEVTSYLEAEEQDVGGERIVATWDASGTNGWQSPVEIYGLHRVSYNVIEVEDPGDQGWVVDVDSDAESVRAVVVLPRDAGVEQVEIVDGTAEVHTAADDTTMLLVVAATDPAGSDGPAVPYAYRITPATAEPTAGAGTGCGCTTGGASAPAGATVAFAALVARRRARPLRPRPPR